MKNTKNEVTLYEYGTLTNRTPCHVDPVGSDWSVDPRGPRPPAPTYPGVAGGSPAWFMAMALDSIGENPEDYDVEAWGAELRERVNRHLAPDLQWGDDHVFRSPIELEEAEADRRIHAALESVCPEAFSFEGDDQGETGALPDPQGRAVDRYDRLRTPVTPEQIRDLWAGAIAYIDQGEQRCILTRPEMTRYFLRDQSEAWGEQVPGDVAVRFARFWSGSWIDIVEVAPSEYDDPRPVRLKRAIEDVRNGAALPGVAHRHGFPVEELVPIRQQWLNELDQAHNAAVTHLTAQECEWLGIGEPPRPHVQEIDAAKEAAHADLRARYPHGNAWGHAMIEAAYMEALRYDRPDDLTGAVRDAAHLRGFRADTESGYRLEARRRVAAEADRLGLDLYR